MKVCDDRYCKLEEEDGAFRQENNHLYQEKMHWEEQLLALLQCGWKDLDPVFEAAASGPQEAGIE